MTIEEARKLIPPGWVECGETAWANNATHNWRMRVGVDVIRAIPAPKPEPRRVPMGNMSLWCDSQGRPSVCNYWMGYANCDYANTRWKPDHDAREWVEVVE